MLVLDCMDTTHTRPTHTLSFMRSACPSGSPAMARFSAQNRNAEAEIFHAPAVYRSLNAAHRVLRPTCAFKVHNRRPTAHLPTAHSCKYHRRHEKTERVETGKKEGRLAVRQLKRSRKKSGLNYNPAHIQSKTERGVEIGGIKGDHNRQNNRSPLSDPRKGVILTPSSEQPHIAPRQITEL